MAFTGPREAIQDIRELHETYSDAVVRQDLETYLACWAEDGRRTGEGGKCHGKAELRTHWLGIFRAIEKMAFFPQLASITVDGQRASARSYCLGVHPPPLSSRDDAVAASDPTHRQGWMM